MINMVRDRTAALRAASDNNCDGQVTIHIPGPRSMESFHGDVTAIQETLDNLQSYIDQMRKLSSAVVSPLNDEKETGKTFEDITFKIQKAAERIRDKLKIMRNSIDSMSESAKSSVEYRVKDTQHITLQKRFADMMYAFYQLQTEYRERCKKVLVAQLEVKGKLTTDEEIDQLLETKDPQIFTERILNEAQVAKQQLADIQARHQQFLNLEKSIRDLRDLFFDVYMLVDAQGEMIDRIEYQVSQTKEYVEKANAETSKALMFQQKARRKKTMIYICLAVVLVVVVGVIVGSFR